MLIIWGFLSLYVKVVQFRDGEYQDIGLVSQMAFGVIGIVLGLYLLGWSYRWAERISVRWTRMKRSIRQGSLVIPFALVGLVMAVVGILIGYDMALAYRESLLPSERSLAISILIFVSGCVWFIVFGVFAYESGKSVTAFLQTGKIKWSFIVMMVSVLATGFIVQGSVDALGYFLKHGEYDLVIIFSEMVTGIMIAIFSSVLNASLRREAATKGSAQGA
ncbi:TPA: DUF373 family protein [Thermoplasmata archaeon]|nr:DUF373 family protein [Thermoplasmata archaeon]